MKHHTAKIIFFIAILTAFIIGMSLFSQNLLHRNSKSLEAAISATEKCIDTNNWKGAESGLAEVSKIWSDVKATWSALIDHAEIDNIDVTLAQLKMLIKAKELPDSLSEAAALKTYIGHIPEKEKLSLKNLL